MKGKSDLFGSKNALSGRWGTKSYDLKNHIHPHKLPDVSTPNSTIEQRDDNGNLVRIRHYDDKGKAWKDVDYTDHGTPDVHKVPHTHIIGIIDNHIDRKRGARSYGNF